MSSATSKVRVMIPTFQMISNVEKPYTVYCVEVIFNGKVTMLEKRYQQFYELHRKLQKVLFTRKTFPPKRVLNKDEKFLESRRQALEQYLQSVLHEVQDDIPERLSEFLQLPNDMDCSSIDELFNTNTEFHQRQHQNVISFKQNLYLYPTKTEIEEENILPCIIAAGCLDGFYR